MTCAFDDAFEKSAGSVETLGPKSTWARHSGRMRSVAEHTDAIKTCAAVLESACCAHASPACLATALLPVFLCGSWRAPSPLPPAAFLPSPQVDEPACLRTLPPHLRHGGYTRPVLNVRVRVENALFSCAPPLTRASMQCR